MITEIISYDEIQHPCIHSSEKCSVYIEDSTVRWLLHCYVQKWSKSTYNELLSVLLDVLDVSPRGEVFAVSDSDKLTKFAELFGFISYDDLHDSKGNKIGELLKCSTR